MRPLILTLPILVCAVLAVPQRGERSVERSLRDEVAVRDGLAVQERRNLGVHNIIAPGAVATVDGSNANTVSALQWLLTAHGHATDVDGSLGPNTRAAVTAFQRDAGLEADGIAGPDTLGALVETVKFHAKGDIVKAAQAALNGNGAHLVVNGDFDTATRAAVVTFQRSRGLPPNGIVTSRTWTALFSTTGGSGGSGVTSPTPSPTSTPTPIVTADCGNVTTGATIDQTTIAAANIRVNKCLAPAVARMVADAAADGITLTAESSWRDPQEQIRLRIQNCGGNTTYNIYEKPWGECTPRTAIPGTSRHERGLAIDIHDCNWGSPNFNWMSAHAGLYHLYLLTTNDEPWHWSWDGQ